jgi:hypothetical protein
MDDLIPEVVRLLAFEGDEGCTIGELEQLMSKYIPFPFKNVAELNDDLLLKACQALLARSDVLFEESAQPAIASAQGGIPANVRNLKLRCTKARVERALVGGQVSLLFQLSDSERSMLKALGKKRFDGMLQAEMHKEIGDVSKLMIPVVVSSLVQLDLVVKIPTKFEQNKGKTSNFTFLIFLPCFAPEAKANNVDNEVQFVSEARTKVQETEKEKVKYRNAILTLLKNAPGQVLYSNEMRRLLKVKKHEWTKMIRLLIDEEVLEECLYKPPEKGIGVICLRLFEKKEEQTAEELEESESEDEEVKLDGSNVLAEGWPMFDVVKCFESIFPGETKRSELATRCHKHQKRFTNKILDVLEKANIVTKRKYQQGREMGFLYKLNVPGNIERSSQDAAAAPGQDNGDASITSQHTLRKNFAMGLLKKRNFVSLTVVKQLARAEAELKGLFEDKKTVKRLAARLKEEGLCEYVELSFRNKTTMQFHPVSVILRKGLELDHNLLNEIKGEDSKALLKPFRDTSQLEQVHEVACLFLARHSIKAEEGEEGVKRETMPAGLEGQSAEKPGMYKRNLEMKLNGMLPGFVARAWCLHVHMWRTYNMQNQQNDASGQCPLDLRECIFNMSVDDYVRIIGLPELPSELFETKCTKMGDLPLAIQEAVYDRGAQSRTLKLIDLLKELMLLEEHYHLPESDEAPTTDGLKFLVTKKTHLVLKNKKIPKDFGFAIDKETPGQKLGGGEEKITFSLDTQHKCMLYWKCLEKIFCGVNQKEFGNSKYLSYGLINRLNKKEHWSGDQEPTTTNNTPNFKRRRDLVNAITNKPDIILSRSRVLSRSSVNKGKLKTLSLSYKIKEKAVEEIGKLWVSLHWGVPASAAINTEIMRESHVDDVSFFLGEEEKHVSYFMKKSDKVPSTPNQKYARLRQKKKFIGEKAISELGEETRKADGGASTSGGERLTKEEELSITARAFAIATLTQGAPAFVYWHKIPHMQEHLNKFATKHWKKLKEVPRVSKAIEALTALCGTLSQGGEEDAVTAALWTYPDDLAKMCEEDQDLEQILAERGKSFTRQWYLKMEELVTLAKQQAASKKDKKLAVVAKPKVKKRKAVVAARAADQIKGKATKKTKISPPAEPMPDLPTLQPAVKNLIKKKPKKKVPPKEVPRVKGGVQKGKKPGPSNATAVSTLAAALLSHFLEYPTRMPKKEIEAFSAFIGKQNEADLMEAIKDMESNGLLQISESDDFTVPLKAKQLLHSSIIPRDILLHVGDRYRNQIDVSEPVYEKQSTLELLNILSLHSVGGISLQVGEEALSMFSGDKESLDRALNKPVHLEYDRVKMEDQARLASFGEFESQARKCPSPQQQRVQYDKSSIEQTLLDEIRGTAHHGYKLSGGSFDKFGESQVRATLLKLVDQGKVITVNVGDCKHYIHSEYSGRFCCQTEEAGRKVLPHRPWLTASGEVNGEVLGAITTKILSLVFRSPGIKGEDILAQFEVLNELDLLEVLTLMVSSNLMYETVVKGKTGVFGREAATCQSTRHYFTKLLPHQFVQ